MIWLDKNISSLDTRDSNNNKPDLARITRLSPLTCVLAVDPCDEVDPLDGEFGCRWWAQLPFSLSLSLRPTKDGLGMCQESGLPATAVVAAVASIWKQRKSTWSFDCITDNVAPITLLPCPHVLHLQLRVVYLSPHREHYSTYTLSFIRFISVPSVQLPSSWSDWPILNNNNNNNGIRTTRLNPRTISPALFSNATRYNPPSSPTITLQFSRRY